jgi:hypothetical protein
MDVELKFNSPLQYLDYDVSRYLYENYFPSRNQRLLKQKFLKEYIKKQKEYLMNYELDNFYEQYRIVCMRRNLYHRLSFVYYLNLNKNKFPKKCLLKTRSQRRATEYKIESNKLKKLLSINY